MAFHSKRMLLIGLGVVVLASCASAPDIAEAPQDAQIVATVRHTAGPQPAAEWVDLANLPGDAFRTDAGRALLLEVASTSAGALTVESAPLELANLIARIDQADRSQTVVSIENRGDQPIAFDLYVSLDGTRFRSVPSCPAQPARSSFERWPEPAQAIAIANIRRADAPVDGCK